MLRSIIPLSVFLLVLSTAVTRADFPELFNTEPDNSPPLMSAADALASLKLPEGFEATLFAAEPDVQNPIDLSWDARGRLWIAENYTYAERSQKFQLDLRDRVVVLEDVDNDGVHDKRTVFTDNVQMLTSVEVGHGGVWLMCPPKLLFIPDADRDDVPDAPAEVVLDGFEVATQNYHNFANGLRFGPDGWLYGRCGGSCPGRIGKPGTDDAQRVALEGGIWRYHPKTKACEVLTAGTTNPWGHDWDEMGELFFINTVNGHLWHGIPGAHFTRPFTLDPNRRTYELIDFHADHWHFDTGQSWTKSRDGAANDYGGGHAHCGMMIYQGDNWPAKYHGKLFTLNFHGRRANQETLKRDGCGFVASHDADMFLSNDPWFRGMEMSTGPDGSVYVLDWSDTGECHEHTGVHRTSGRIFKIRYADKAERAGGTNFSQRVDLHQLSPEALAGLQTDSNAWVVNQSRLVLAERAAAGLDLTAAAALLRAQFANVNGNSADRDQVRALLTLHTIAAVDDEFLTTQLRHPNEFVRVWAIRLLTETWQIDDCMKPADRDVDQIQEVAEQYAELQGDFCRLAQSDTSGLVRLALASALQRLPIPARAQLATFLVGHESDADDHNQPLMIWYGLIPVADQRPADLVPVALAAKLPTTLRLIARRLAEDVESNPAPIDQLVAAAAAGTPPWRGTVVQGIAQAMKGWRRAPKPEAWDALVAATKLPEVQPVLRDLSVVFGDGRALASVRRVALDDDAPPAARLQALETLIRSQPADLLEICRPLLKNGHLNVLAAQGLATYDDPAVGKAIVERYKNFRAPQRPKIVSILSSRVVFATALLDAIGQGKIPRADLSAFQVRQIHALGDDQLSEQVGREWGEIRETDAQKQSAIETIKRRLTGDVLAAADRSAGRSLFVKQCQNCHQLYGQGGKVGPDLTGANRSNLDYLLGNVIDPSGVVDKDFRMTLVLTEDGRVISGLVTERTERTVTVQTATEAVTINRDQISSEKQTDLSPMPEGLLDNLSAEQVRNLVGYLVHPSQVTLPE